MVSIYIKKRQKSFFDLEPADRGFNVIEAVKVYRRLTGLGLYESKRVICDIPVERDSELYLGEDYKLAFEIYNQLKAIGCPVEIEGSTPAIKALYE